MRAQKGEGEGGREEDAEEQHKGTGFYAWEAPCRLTSGVAPVLDELDALASDEQLGGDGLGAVMLDPLNARRGWCEKHRLAVHQTGQEAKQRVGGCVLAKAARVVRVGDGKQDLGDLAVTACLVFHRVQNRRSTGGHA